jgi:hypothetical protein
MQFWYSERAFRRIEPGGLNHEGHEEHKGYMRFYISDKNLKFHLFVSFVFSVVRPSDLVWVA